VIRSNIKWLHVTTCRPRPIHESFLREIGNLPETRKFCPTKVSRYTVFPRPQTCTLYCGLGMRLVYNTDVAIFASSSFVLDGIGYKELMAMCLRYREHLSECANIMGIEQAR